MKKDIMIEIVIPNVGNGVVLKVGKRNRTVNAKTVDKLKEQLLKAGLKVIVK